MKINKNTKATKQIDTDNMHGDHIASCVCCEHAEYYAGSPGYSDVTPGVPASMRCNKSHWEFDDFLNINLINFMHDAGRRCADFAPRNDTVTATT